MTLLLLAVAVLVAGSIVIICLETNEKISNLESLLATASENTVSPMTRWTNDAIIEARNAHLTNGWIPEGCRLYEFRIYGCYRFVAGIIATSETEAREKLKKGYVAYGTTPDAMRSIPAMYGGWCSDGYDHFMIGLPGLSVDQPVYDEDYDSVGVMRAYPTVGAEALFEFGIVYDDPAYPDSRTEYCARVLDTSFQSALERLLTGQDVFRGTSDTSAVQNMAANERAIIALAMLSPVRQEWSYACFGLDKPDTFASWRVVQEAS